MAVDYRNPAATKPVRTGFAIVAYPLQRMVDAPINLYTKVTGFFANQTHLASENSALKEQLRLYSVQYRDMQVLEQQNARLRELLKVDKRVGYTFTMAEVIAASDERGRQVVTLNKGSRDGVHEKQVVLAEGGNIYGQVVEVTPFSSKVMELTDRQHAIPVRNLRTGMRALANGTGKADILELKSIVAGSSSNVQDGDVFVSSGLDMLFPPDFPVAKVIPNGVQYISGDPFANISAKPMINFDNTREVLLLWRISPSPVEMLPAIPPAAPTAPAKPADIKNKKDEKTKKDEKPANKPTTASKPAGHPQ